MARQRGDSNWFEEVSRAYRKAATIDTGAAVRTCRCHNRTGPGPQCSIFRATQEFDCGRLLHFAARSSARAWIQRKLGTGGVSELCSRALKLNHELSRKRF